MDDKEARESESRGQSGDLGSRTGFFLQLFQSDFIPFCDVEYLL